MVIQFRDSKISYPTITACFKVKRPINIFTDNSRFYRTGRYATLASRVYAARQFIKRIHLDIRNLLVNVQRGQPLERDILFAVADRLMTEMCVNADAMLFCCRQKKADSYTSLRCISFSALLFHFARHAGFSRQRLRRVVIGGLLHDVGKMRVSQAIIHKSGRLNTKEYAYVKDHVVYSAAILQNLGIKSKTVKDIVLQHHERIDGSGYPSGITEEDLSEIAQMAMIVDVYDALTSNRNYKQALAPVEALHYLLDEGAKHFNQHYVHMFIKSIGVYPIGSIVKLANGAVGAVTRQTEHLLYPYVKVVYDANNARHLPPTQLDTRLLRCQSTEVPAIVPVLRDDYPVYPMSCLVS